MNLRDIVTLFKNHQIQYGLMVILKTKCKNNINGNWCPNKMDTQTLML